MQSDIEKQIRLSENLIKQEKYDETNLINLSKKCLSSEVNREIFHKILDFAHLKGISQYISDIKLTNSWFDLLLKMIIKSNFHTGYMLQQRANRYKDNIAFNIIKKGHLKKLTYSTLWSLVIEVGRSISTFEMKSKKPVIGILSHNQLNSVLVDLACLSFGYRIVPIPLNATPKHISYIIAHAEISHLFIGEKSGIKLLNEIKDYNSVNIFSLNDNQININHITWEKFLEKGDAIKNFDLKNKLSSLNIENIQTIMYTSGTTDNPKGIPFNHINIISKRFARALALPLIGSEDIFLSYLPLFHTFGRYFELMGSIFWGATYSFAESPAFNSLLNDFKIVKPTVFISIPKRWVQLYELMDNKLNLDSDETTYIKKQLDEITGGSLKWGLSAAGYLDPDIFSFFYDMDINLLSGYGMTEATGGITMTPPNDYQRDSVGKALPGINIKLAEDGELCINGAYVATSYFKDEKSKIFKEGWFHTEDIFKEKNKHYYIIDRKKDIYKNSRGQTIAPQKIENLFQDFDSIKSVFLVGDGKEFNTVLIYPEFDNSKIEHNSKNLVEVRNLFSSMILSVNSFLSPFERIVNYVIINRNFSKKRGELTPKGTFIRKKILENFKEIISPLYEKNYSILHYDNKEIRIPNWIIREIGTVKSNLKWDGQILSISDSLKSLTLNWGKDTIHIGDFYYTYKTNTLDFDSIIQSPNLWIGNFQFANFTGPTIFRLKESSLFDDLTLVDIRKNITLNNEKMEHQIDTTLYAIHIAVRAFLEGDSNCFDSLKKIIDTKLGNWSSVIIETLLNFRDYHDPIFRIKLLEVIAPLISGDLFIDLLHNAYTFHRKKDYTKGFSFTIERTNDDHYHSLIQYLKKSKNNIKDKDNIEQEFIKTLLLLIADFGIMHPTRFVWARSELVSWQLSKVPKPIYSTAQKAYYSLVKGFRSWIGHSTNITVDHETGEEYSWKDVINFDDNMRQSHKERLLIAISETSLIRESLFLFSKSYLIDLNDIPKNGIWISHLGSQNNKSVFRLLIRTRNYGNHNLVINLNENWEREFIDDETRWLIKMGPGFKDLPLVEKFGGYWPEYSLYTEEYIQGETLDNYLKRNENDINEKIKIDRWQMRWLHFIWSGIQAYQEFWNRTNLQLSIQPPNPDNLIIPQRDYKTGTRLISISRRKPIVSLAEHFLSLFTDYIVMTEKKYPGLNHMSDWEVIFTATIQALKVKKGKQVLVRLKSEIQIKNIRKKCELIGLTVERIEQFLEEIDNFGVLTKPVVFASLRYERWLDLNQEATVQAKASILKELYKDYELDNLLEEYPETRVRFFMMTCFKKSDKYLFDEFSNIIKDMRKNLLSPWEMQDRISLIQSNENLNKDEKFFLALMLFPHVDSANYIELVTTAYGEKARINLVSQTECKDGKLYRIRPPFVPKEIARFHNLLTESALSATFTAKHEFLLVFNSRNRLSGGLYWKNIEPNKIYLEWVVIRKQYQKIALSKRLMSDFFKRMGNAGINIITVGFYAQDFFSKHGFKIEKQYGGLVKHL
ncbi:MAG: GNAT family N-acetyltransferase [Candidatus Neomarinimicrobiota bacterium]